MLRFVVRSIRNLLCVPFLPIWAIARWLSRPKGRWIVVRLKPRLVEARQPLPWLRRLLGADSLRRTSSLAAVRRLADYADQGSQLEGVAFVLPPLQAGWSVCVGLREQILRLRDAGKPRRCYCPEAGASPRALRRLCRRAGLPRATGDDHAARVVGAVPLLQAASRPHRCRGRALRAQGVQDRRRAHEPRLDERAAARAGSGTHRWPQRGVARRARSAYRHLARRGALTLRCGRVSWPRRNRRASRGRARI